MATNKIKLVVKPTRSIPMVVKPVPKIGLMSMTPTKGDPGVGIESLEQTTKSTESGGTNVWTATLTDGTVHDFEVMNGDAGEGIAAGGEPGQALIKASNADYATRWMSILPEDTASGAVASFPDGADDLPMGVVVDIDPVQDLHGYDNPWPAGGGKNKINYLACIGLGERNGTDSVSISVSVSSDTITVTDYGSYNAGGKILKGIGHPSITGAFTVSADVKCTASQIAFGVGAYEGGGTSDVNATYAVTPNTWTHISRTFTDKTYAEIGIFLQPKENADVLEIKNLQIESGSTATAYAPYSNICPISGWDEAKVTRTGRNLLKVKYPGRTHNGVTYVTNEDGTITLTGTASGSSYFASNYGFITDYMTLLPAGTYTISGTPNSNIRVYGTKFALDGTNLGNISQDTGSGSTFTIAEPTWFTPQVYVASGTATNLTLAIQVQVGSQKTAYEPYQAVTHEIPFSTEVYGGTLDVETGELVVDRAMVDLGTLSYSSDAKRPNVKFSYSLANSMMKRSPWADAICSHYQLRKVGPDSLTSGQFSTMNAYGAGSVFFKDDAFIGLTGVEVKERLAGVQFCYQLETPITLTIDTVEIRSLFGDNNVWSDTGNTSVTYKADIQKYIDKKISAAVAAMS